MTSADCAELFEQHWGAVYLERIETGIVLDSFREECVSDTFIFPGYRVGFKKHNLAMLKLQNNKE